MLIYKLTNTVNGKAYIGLTTRTVKHRFTQHCRADSVIGKAIRKYGKDSFKVETVETVKDANKLGDYEKFYIWLYDTKVPNGYNLTDGGESGVLGYSHTEESKQKIGEAMKGKKRTEETKQKLSEANKGRPSPMLGKKLSEESKQKISKSNKGKNLSEESKQRMREAHECKPVAQYDLDGRLLQIHKSIREAERTTNVNNGNINKVCNGKQDTAGGYIWLFI